MLRVARGQKLASGCGTIVGSVVLVGVISGIIGGAGSSINGDDRTALVFSITIPAVGIAYFQFLRWQAVTGLVARYQCDIVPVAQILGTDPLDWLARPAEAQSYLAALDSTRKQFEQTYLDLT